MRKQRGWSATDEISQIQVIKPTLLTFYFNGENIFLKWNQSIGCVDYYRVYGGNEINNFSFISQVNTTFFEFKSQNSPFFVTVSAVFQGIESEHTQAIKVKEEKIEPPVIMQNSVSDSLVVSNLVNNNQVQQNSSNPVVFTSNSYLKPEAKKTELPFGVCKCCLIPQPLMKRKNNIVCSKNVENIYQESGTDWVLRPKQILSDVERMDEILRQNSAYVGLGGILLNNVPNRYL